jgi:hypothetical protein
MTSAAELTKPKHLALNGLACLAATGKAAEIDQIATADGHGNGDVEPLGPPPRQWNATRLCLGKKMRLIQHE